MEGVGQVSLMDFGSLYVVSLFVLFFSLVIYEAKRTQMTGFLQILTATHQYMFMFMFMYLQSTHGDTLIYLNL